jgi:threonine synthase
MQQAKKRGRKEAAAPKGPGEAPSKAAAPPTSAASTSVSAAAPDSAASTAPTPSFVSPLQKLLVGEFRKRLMTAPAESLTDLTMQSVVQLAETLYVDEILKETSGNVSLAGKMAKIT